MRIAAMSGGGFGIHQCPYVSDLLKSWGMSECRRATTIGSHDSWKQQEFAVEVLEQIPLHSDVRLAQKCAGAMLWLFTRSRPDLSCRVSRMASLCNWCWMHWFGWTNKWCGSCVAVHAAVT